MLPVFDSFLYQRRTDVHLGLKRTKKEIVFHRVFLDLLVRDIGLASKFLHEPYDPVPATSTPT